MRSLESAPLQLMICQYHALGSILERSLSQLVVVKREIECSQSWTVAERRPILSFWSVSCGVATQVGADGATCKLAVAVRDGHSTQVKTSKIISCHINYVVTFANDNSVSKPGKVSPR